MNFNSLFGTVTLKRPKCHLPGKLFPFKPLIWYFLSMRDYNSKEHEMLLQEMDALIEHWKSGRANELDRKRTAYLVEFNKYLKEGREDKLKELKCMIDKEFGCP